MSLVIAFNLNDYAILATDKRGVLSSYKNEDEETILSIDDHYQKLRKIPFGFFAAAGDYFITEIFYQECLLKTEFPQNLDKILKDTYDRYTNLKGIRHFEENTNILLIARGFDDQYYLKKDAVLQITFKYGNIKIEDVNPMSIVALMANMNPDPIFWDKVVSNLRTVYNFNHFEAFINYHIHLIKYIWHEQLKFDNLISNHIDFYFHNRHTGEGLSLSAEEFETIPNGLLQHFPKIREITSNLNL